MDTNVVSVTVDRAIATYTQMGLRGDQQRRQQLREIQEATSGNGRTRATRPGQPRGERPEALGFS